MICRESEIISQIKRAFSHLLSILPKRIIVALRESGLGEAYRISELRLRALGPSEVILDGRRIRLGITLAESDIAEIFSGLVSGRMYMYEDTIRKGYISQEFGIRVGLVGNAHYDGGRLRGIHSLFGLVFRMPFFDAEIGKSIIKELGAPASTLIYSPPGGGKTTALRSLVRAVCERGAVRLIVVDERCEFDRAHFSSLGVDILSGFHKADGLEIAIRLLNPEIIVTDEITAGEYPHLREALSSGITVIGTIHASDVRDIRSRPELSELLGEGGFKYSVGIVRQDGKHKAEVSELS